MNPDIESSLGTLRELFSGVLAENNYGEKVSMSEHLTQSAYVAEKSRYGPEVIAAALLHDVGHGLSSATSDPQSTDAADTHDTQGADFLVNLGFPARVVAGVRHHVDAKRYLVTVEPSYTNLLSAASVATLRLQGGRMTADEVAQFENIQYYDVAVQVRRCDDAGKDLAAPSVSFDYFVPLLATILTRD